MKKTEAESYSERISLPEFSLWERMKEKRNLVSFDLEITARCNNNCRHCYINLPQEDKAAQQRELSAGQINKIADEAVSLGAFWCLISGGEPLLRKDFFEIYLGLKKRGLLVSVFTNAGLITDKHIRLFKSYPPRDIEVSVYGVTKETYERVSRKPGSFNHFIRGLNLLLDSGIRVRLKAMALRSNVGELPEIARFCRQKTKDYFRFDPFLHLRFDRDTRRNAEIKSERLSDQEITAIERADSQRLGVLRDRCDKLIMPQREHSSCGHLFHCGAGQGSFTVSYDGLFRLCSSLWQEDCIYDLKKGSLGEAWDDFVPRVRQRHSDNREFLEKCQNCPIINLCLWCPAHSHLESGRLDEPVDYFCKVAHSRKDMLA
ncbi:radical SAM protein [bacterium]|nr:MAG: radical SAM protein [bacterium]